MWHDPTKLKVLVNTAECVQQAWAHDADPDVVPKPDTAPLWRAVHEIDDHLDSILIRVRTLESLFTPLQLVLSKIPFLSPDQLDEVLKAADDLKKQLGDK